MIASRLSALALAAALGWSVAAQAQTAAPPAGPGHQWSPEAKQRFEAHRAERVKALHDVLNIRPDQEAVFQAFIAARKSERPEWGHKDGGPKAGHEDMAALTTPERLDRMEHKMAEREARHHEAFQRMAAATKALYAALSPEQKRTLDALPELREHPHGEGRGEGWGHGPHGGPERG